MQRKNTLFFRESGRIHARVKYSERTSSISILGLVRLFSAFSFVQSVIPCCFDLLRQSYFSLISGADRESYLPLITGAIWIAAHPTGVLGLILHPALGLILPAHCWSLALRLFYCSARLFLFLCTFWFRIFYCS
jgi:hypothetical protein